MRVKTQSDIVHEILENYKSSVCVDSVDGVDDSSIVVFVNDSGLQVPFVVSRDGSLVGYQSMTMGREFTNSVNCFSEYYDNPVLMSKFKNISEIKEPGLVLGGEGEQLKSNLVLEGVPLVSSSDANEFILNYTDHYFHISNIMILHSLNQFKIGCDLYQVEKGEIMSQLDENSFLVDQGVVYKKRGNQVLESGFYDDDTGQYVDIINMIPEYYMPEPYMLYPEKISALPQSYMKSLGEFFGSFGDLQERLSIAMLSTVDLPASRLKINVTDDRKSSRLSRSNLIPNCAM
ncbi:hypothetical protein [Photobacterium leiognathi]|uniref:hypothetical protein n=1 Tax=Photobacterium leiognathi TaxID=553611 RepID=UPI002981F2CA|nr:hypothetical protein [Photobacterium leiognathi]